MKTNFFICIAVLACIFCTSCSKVEFTSISLLSNAADLVVTNQTTGLSTKSNALPLDVKNGDKITIEYTPQNKYSKYSWKVVFDVFDTSTTITQSPYSMTTTVQDMPIGNHKIRCSAIIADDNVIFTGVEGGYITINIIK